MLKNNYILCIPLLIIIMMSVYPVLNGQGCNYVFDINEKSLYSSGRCEGGILTATVINKETHDVYSLNGRFAIIGEQCFVFVKETNFIQRSNDVNDGLKRYKYFRNIISGKVVNGNYLLMYTPSPKIMRINISGTLSFF